MPNAELSGEAFTGQHMKEASQSPHPYYIIDEAVFDVGFAECAAAIEMLARRLLLMAPANEKSYVDNAAFISLGLCIEALRRRSPMADGNT